MSEILSTQLGAITYLTPIEASDQPGMLLGLQDAVDAAIARRNIQLALDLGNIRYLSSLSQESLLDAHDQLVELGGWLKIANCSSSLRQVLAISGVDSCIGFLNEDAQSPAPAGDGVRLGDLLVARQLIDEQGISGALEQQRTTGKRLGQVLIDEGLVPEQDVLDALSRQLDMPFITLKTGLFDPDIRQLLPMEVASRLAAMPLFSVRGTLAVALSDPQNIAALDEIEERCQYQLRPVLACRDNILDVLLDSSSGIDLSEDLIADIDEDLELVDNRQPENFAAIDELSAGSPIVNLVNAIIQRAVHDGASDIHIEPGPSCCRVRFRVDSVLYEVMTPRAEYHPAIVSRLKVMANLDIAERRLPQDGRLQVVTQNQRVDLRFSSLPGLHGEKIVLRVLDKSRSILDLDRLGFSDANLASFKDILQRSYGLILVTGPTGSGKTTSLYAALNHLNSLEKNIVTVEDPVEYQLDIINQNEVREGIGLSFSRMLKHILRQDPDIVMVGEIRDRETAQIAVQAALTGHLVLSTLHTNDSVSAVTRMIDMGVEPYLLSSALVGVVAQRLVRTICPSCKTHFRPPAEIIERYNWQALEPLRLSQGRGCADCYDSGYKGRLGIHEILTADEELQSLIVSNPSRDALNRYAAQRNLKTLFDDGLQHVLAGATTLEEVTRVTRN